MTPVAEPREALPRRVAVSNASHPIKKVIGKEGKKL
jgi:hypothetical protein